jgi:hypothetical protein
VEFEGSSAPGRLGVTLAPAHVTIALREAVGLAPVAGLLVRTVHDDAPLRPGDVLVRANGRELRSIADLPLDDDTLRLEIVRGAETLALDVTPGPARQLPGRPGEHTA